MKKFYTFFLLLFFVLATACSTAVSQENETSSISLAPFDQVILIGGGNLHFIHSDRSSVDLEGAEISKTEVKVKGDKLYLTTKNRTGNGPLNIYIHTQTLTGIQISGGGTVKIGTGFAAVDRFDCNIHGGGKLDLEAIQINNLDISIYGGGAITAQVEEAITANIVGGGSIRYLGNPKVKTNILGGGSVKRL